MVYTKEQYQDTSTHERSRLMTRSTKVKVPGLWCFSVEAAAQTAQCSAVVQVSAEVTCNFLPHEVIHEPSASFFLSAPWPDPAWVNSDHMPQQICSSSIISAPLTVSGGWGRVLQQQIRSDTMQWSYERSRAPSSPALKSLWSKGGDPRSGWFPATDRYVCCCYSNTHLL